MGAGAIAIVIAAIALAMALRAPGGGDTNAMSGVMTSLSAQSAEVESLSSQISSLQAELADSPAGGSLQCRRAHGATRGPSRSEYASG